MSIEDHCGKATYTDKSRADRAIKLIKRRNAKHIRPVRSYKCPVCGWWHLTSQA